MPAPPPATPTPICPRCGYDQSGVISTWSDSCPLDGICSECGLQFDWADVLVLARHRLEWLYEHADHWLRIGSAFATFMRACLPWRFWKQVRPFHTVRVERLLLWPAMVLVTMSAGWWLVSSICAIFIEIRSSAAKPTNVVAALAESLTIQAGFFHDGSHELDRLPIYLIMGAMFAAGAALIVFVTPSSWRGARLRPAHILRIAIYSLAPTFFLHALLGLYWNYADATTGWSARATGAPFPPLRAVADQWSASLTWLSFLASLAFQTISWACALRFFLAMSRWNTALLTFFATLTGVLFVLGFILAAEGML